MPRPTGPKREWLDGDYFSDELEEGHTLYDHSVHAVHKPTKEVVGQMLYHIDGPIFQIDVDPAHQRKGIATEMVKHATRVSDASDQRIPYPQRAYNETDDGEAWADSMKRRGMKGFPE